MPKFNAYPSTVQLNNTDIMLADTQQATNTRKIAYSDLRTQLQNESKSVFALKGEVATDEQVADAVGDWLEEHVTPTMPTVLVDDTLSIEGAAAEAKTAGDVIDEISNTVDELKTQTTYALTSAEVSALGTIFDVERGKYFTVTGSRLKSLIDHDTNSNVPVGNVAPSTIVDSVSYLVYTWKYTDNYGFYEIKSVRGTVHIVGGTGASHPNYITWFDISHEKIEGDISEINNKLDNALVYLTPSVISQAISENKTIFELSTGIYFTASGAQIRTLADHNTNSRVPENNSIPSAIDDQSTYIVKVYKYFGDYGAYEISLASGNKKFLGSTTSTRNYINWTDQSPQNIRESISKLNASVKNSTPIFDGDSFGWEVGKLLRSTGELGSNAKVATSYPVSVNPGDVFVNKSLTTDDGGNCYLYVGYYSGETFINRVGHVAPDVEYVVPSGVNNLRFSFGVSFAETHTYYMDDVKLKNLFHVQFITEYKQATSFIDSEKPLYIALGASTTWAAVHHPNSDPITQSPYQYPIIAGNLMGADVVNLAIGSTGVMARTNVNSYVSGARVNSIAFNNGDNNYMDLVYANNGQNSELYNLFSNASLITLSLAVGNDFTPVSSGGIGLPLGNYDDYYPYDAEGYHISGTDGPAQMKALGATYFGCVNWIIKWISEHYPKAQLTIIEIHMSDNSKRTIDVIDNPESGSPKKLQFTNPFPETSTYYKLNDGLKTLANLIKFPFINLFEDGIPYNYYNSNAKDSEGKYILFSTTGNSGSYAFNVHPNDAGYLMIARYIAGRIAGVFGR